MKRLSVPLFLLLGCLSLGCAARVYTPAGVEVSTMPPPDRVEYVPVAPGPGHVWVRGHWGWDGHRHYWVRGRYLRRPASHYVWRPAGWVHVRGRYRYVPGRWITRHRGRVEAPPPPHRHLGRR